MIIKIHRILHVEKPEDFTHTHTHKRKLKLIKEFSTVAVYKINIQKSVVFLLIMNYQKEKLRKQSHLQLHQKE